MASQDPRAKNIKIKTGVVKRYGKERVYYIKELEKQQAKIAKMKEEGADIHDINKQEEVARESEIMIPDCLRRLKTSWHELSILLEQEKDLAEDEIYKQAQEALNEYREVVVK